MHVLKAWRSLEFVRDRYMGYTVPMHFSCWLGGVLQLRVFNTVTSDKLILKLLIELLHSLLIAVVCCRH